MRGQSVVVDRIAAARGASGRPVVVGVSGCGGSGTSTLARELTSAAWSVRLRGDDFLDPDRSHRRSADWDGVERDRLAAEVLAPFRAGRAGTFRRYDWSRRALGEPEPLPVAEVLVVDLVGLFHPAVLGLIDVAVWMDVDLGVATERGKARDAASNHDHQRLWDEVWMPNDRDFAQRFDPRGAADVLVDNHREGSAEILLDD